MQKIVAGGNSLAKLVMPRATVNINKPLRLHTR